MNVLIHTVLGEADAKTPALQWQCMTFVFRSVSSLITGIRFTAREAHSKEKWLSGCCGEIWAAHAVLSCSHITSTRFLVRLCSSGQQ